MGFKERLKSLRKEKRLTQGDLAEILNYGYTAISNYESGRNEPSIADLKKIAVFFDVSMDYLLCVNDFRNPYIESDYVVDFDEFKKNYVLLNDTRRREMKSFMNWIIKEQEKENMLTETDQQSEQVAESKVTYITKKNTDDSGN